MNDHVSWLLQGYAARRELVQLLQPERLGLANQWLPKKARGEPMRVGVPKTSARLSILWNNQGENNVSINRY
jgi:hypothetical protein